MFSTWKFFIALFSACVGGGGGGGGMLTACNITILYTSCCIRFSFIEIIIRCTSQILSQVIHLANH